MKRAQTLEIFFSSYKEHLVPEISVQHNFLIVNVIHLVIHSSFEYDGLVVAGQFCHQSSDRGCHNDVVITSRQEESAIIIVVGDISVNNHHGSPGVENGVRDDGAKRGSADHIVAVEHRAEDTVVVVVRDASIVHRTDVVRDTHMAAEVVVIGVHKRVVVVVTQSFVVIIPLRNRLRLCYTLTGVSSLGFCRTVGGRAGNSSALTGRRGRRACRRCGGRSAHRRG